MLDKIKTLVFGSKLESLLFVRKHLNNFKEDVEVVGKAKSNEELINLLLSKKPYLLILDINSNENPLEVLKDFDSLTYEIIIISSSEKFAIEAINNFNISAYVLKPIKEISFIKAIKSTIEKIKNKERFDLNNLQVISNEIIAIPTINHIELISTNNILYLEADRKYTVFYLEDNTKIVASKNIGEYEKILFKQNFFRVHNKHIVNLTKVSKIDKTSGSYCVIKNKKSISISRRRQDLLKRYLSLK